MRIDRIPGIAAALCLTAAACVARPPEPAQAPSPTPASGQALTQLEQDPHSFARPNEARVTHVTLDLTADFATKRLSGTAGLDIQRAPMGTEIILDTRDLDIQQVTDRAGRALQYTSGPLDSIRGR